MPETPTEPTLSETQEAELLSILTLIADLVHEQNIESIRTAPETMFLKATFSAGNHLWRGEIPLDPNQRETTPAKFVLIH